MSEVDWTKPLQTRGGCPARLVDKNFRGLGGDSDHPMLVVVTRTDGSEWLSRHDRSGLKQGYVAHDQDSIVNAPEKHEVWLNIFSVGAPGEVFSLGTIQKSREVADAQGMTLRNRIACVRIEFEEGEGL